MKRWPLILSRAVVLLLAVWSCSKNSAGGDDVDDGNTPYFISDFMVDSVTDSSVLLTWTATGDDSNQGTASTYDIRYWHTWLAPANWDSAIQLTGEPHPKVAGSKESLWVHDLKKDTTYYFGMIVADEAGNDAGSNGCYGTCFTDRIVTFADWHLDSAIRANFGKPNGDLLLSDLRAHDGLFANEAGIVSLAGLEEWKNLTSLGLASNEISDLGPLSGLHRLLYLGLTGNNLSDISALAGLDSLVLLHLRSNSLSDLTALAYLTRIRQLDLTQNQITNVEPLLGNTGLGTGDTIWIGENPLSSEATTYQIPELQSRGVAVLGL